MDMFQNHLKPNNFIGKFLGFSCHLEKKQKSFGISVKDVIYLIITQKGGNVELVHYLPF